MEVWHQKKFENYKLLCTSLKANHWSAHLFAIEVGTRGYCSTTVRLHMFHIVCLCCLGFSGKLLKSIIKKLSLSSLKASFPVWLSKDYERWLEEKVTISPIKTVSNAALSSSSALKTSKFTSDCQAIQASVKIYGILNKGDTCYINTTLQCLSIMMQFWSSFQKHCHLLCLPL